MGQPRAGKTVQMRKGAELAAIVAMLAMIVPAARAQLGLYGAFTGANLSGPGASWMYGGTFGGYYDSFDFPMVNFGLDLRFAFLGGGGNPSATTGLAGPRAVLHFPAFPLRPYAEALAGGAHFTQSGVDTTTLDYGVAAGLDTTIFPRIDWRVIDYQHTWSSSGIQETSLSSGLVLRIPFL